MKFNRSSGILLHPTSLPGKHGIGDLGPGAFQWLDFLKSSGCSLWQVLPLGPTGYGDSPYQSFSAFAGNPFLVSPDALLQDGLLHSDDLIENPGFISNRVDYGRVIPYKLGILNRAYNRMMESQLEEIKTAFRAFINDEAFWLNDFAIFMAIKESQGGNPWVKWPEQLRDRNKNALDVFSREQSSSIVKHQFYQFLFFRQWKKIKDYAGQIGIQIIGDIPIFIAHDSSDVWANPELYYLAEDGNPTVVAGVPPDYFSPTGQRWGNPLYRWDVHLETKYDWWVKRFRNTLKFVDIIRLDHFRGFAGYWEIPADEETAINGKWVDGPGQIFFDHMKRSLGNLPILAEDLGEITPDVIKLRDDNDLPGMKILVFAFNSGSTNAFLPHNHSKRNVVYTGTHDNDTVRGWFENAGHSEIDFLRRYLGIDGSNIAWDLIRAAWASVAFMAITPMQDLLELGNHARMNYPSKLGGNWVWRMQPDAMKFSLSEKISELNQLYNR